MDEIFDQLIEFGLTEVEARIYLQIGQTGKISAANLAKRTDLPRTTIYSALKGLVRRGLISEEHKASATQFMWSGPAALMRQIDREKQLLANRERSTRKLVEQITAQVHPTTYSVPKIQFFEGKRAVEGMLYDNMELWRDSLSRIDGIWWGYQDPSFVSLYRKWLESYWVTMRPNERVQLLSNETPSERALRNKVKGRTIRTVPSSYKFNSTIWVCGDYLVLLMSAQAPHYAFQIRDPIFTSNLRIVFELLWDLLGGTATR